jgi:hypothetical protein
MSFRPGTVSKILWHFTGGPLWDAATNKQLKELKPAKSGYAALNAIISSSELRVGNYHEIVKVIVPKRRKYNRTTKKFETLFNHPVEVKSSPVCCVADIPLQHISYHANRYGKIAIGFHREAIVRAGFNPVMYTLEDTALLNSIYGGYTAIDDADPFDAKNELDNFGDEIASLLDEHKVDESVDPSGVETALDFISDANQKIDDGYKKLLAHIKTFDKAEFDSIYCEREWRSTNPFKFTTEDIALIVLPKNQDGFSYYDDFLSNTSLPRKITIAAWEDLIEH